MAAEEKTPSRTRAIAANDAAAFVQARDFLLQNRTNYAAAYENFHWPKLEAFNWALDYFDVMAAGNTQPALMITTQNLQDQSLSFGEISQRSNQVANFLQQLGVSRGDRILVMLGNEIALWETMLAASKLGAVVVPTSNVISTDDLNDRLERGGVRHVISNVASKDKFHSCARKYTLILVGGSDNGWIEYEQAYSQPKKLRAERPDTSQRSPPPIFHLGDYRKTQAGLAFSAELSSGPSLNDVLDRHPAGRRALEHQLSGLGKARLELVLRSLERGSLHRCIERYPLLCEHRSGHIGTNRRHYALCPSHRMENANQRRFAEILRETAGGGQRG